MVDIYSLVHILVMRYHRSASGLVGYDYDEEKGPLIPFFDVLYVRAMCFYPYRTVSKIIIALPFYPPLQGCNLRIRINDNYLDNTKFMRMYLHKNKRSLLTLNFSKKSSFKIHSLIIRTHTL
jgi:hypothetical protein